MTVDPRIPVIVGVGQSVENIGDSSYRGMSAVELATADASAALQDTGSQASDECRELACEAFDVGGDVGFGFIWQAEQHLGDAEAGPSGQFVGVGFEVQRDDLRGPVAARVSCSSLTGSSMSKSRGVVIQPSAERAIHLKFFCPPRRPAPGCGPAPVSARPSSARS